MPDLTATIPHQLTRDEAKRRIQEHVDVVRKQQGSMLSSLTDQWSDDRMDFSATAMGQTISGHLVVEDQAVQLTVALPWILKMLGDKFKATIEQQGKLLLTKQP